MLVPATAGARIRQTRKQRKRTPEESNPAAHAPDPHLRLVPIFEELFNFHVDNLAMDVVDHIVLKVPRDDLARLVENALPFPFFQTSPIGHLSRGS